MLETERVVRLLLHHLILKHDNLTDLQRENVKLVSSALEAREAYEQAQVNG